MRRFKILAGPTLLILTLVVLAFYLFKDGSNIANDKVAATSKPIENLISQKERELYNVHQQELKDAVKAYFVRAIASGDIVGA